MVLLRFLTAMLGAGEHTLYLVEVFYVALLIGCMGAAYGLLRDLFGQRSARAATLVLMFSPLALYLAFKLLSEIPSLLLVTLGSWAFVRSFLPDARPGSRASLGLATLALAGAALCRITTIVAFAGLGLALLAVPSERFDRPRVLRRLIVVGIGSGLIHTAALALAGGNVLRVASHIHSVVTTHSALQRVYAIGLFVQAFALVLPFAWQFRREPELRVAAVWLVVSALPFLAGHEPRYYVPAVVPFAVVAAAGLRGAVRSLAADRGRYAWAALLAALVLADRVLLVPLMPYEVEQGHLLALFQKRDAQRPRPTYLVPWISDFSLLRFTHPDAPVELCLSNLPGTRFSRPGEGSGLSPADDWWAGAGHYVGSRAILARSPEPWEYIGWTYNPAALRLQRLLAVVGLAPRLPGAELHNHLTGSWIWHDSTLRLTPIDQVGQYHVYQVSPRTRAAGTVPAWGRGTAVGNGSYRERRGGGGRAAVS